MKIKDGFILREIVGSWVVVPIGERVVHFNGLMTLSESGALLWNKLEKDTNIEELLAAILKEYTIDEATAKVDIDHFISSIQEKGLIE